MLTEATLAVGGAGSTGARPALQLILVPPLLPLHVQLHGPVPVTGPGVPAEQSSAWGGALVYCFVLATPHTPLIGVGDAVRVTVKVVDALPAAPLTVTVHVCVPVHVSPTFTSVGVTVICVALCATFVIVAPDELVQVLNPETNEVRVHVAYTTPESLHSIVVAASRPLPVNVSTDEYGTAVPALKLVGDTAVSASAVGAFVALHGAVVPPFEPVHVQVHGPAPATADGVPTKHRFAVGALVNWLPFEAPQTPSTRINCERENCADAVGITPLLPVFPPVSLASTRNQINFDPVAGSNALHDKPLTLAQSPINGKD